MFGYSGWEFWITSHDALYIWKFFGCNPKIVNGEHEFITTDILFNFFCPRVNLIKKLASQWLLFRYSSVLGAFRTNIKQSLSKFEGVHKVIT